MKVGIVIDGLSDDIDLCVYNEKANATLAPSQASSMAIEDVILDLQLGCYVVAADVYGSNQSD